MTEKKMVTSSVNFAIMIPLLIHFGGCQRAITSMSKSLLMEGEPVNISCLTEIHDQELNPVTVLLKHILNNEEQRIADSFPEILPNSFDTSPVEIATNHFLNEDIFDSKRYRCSYHLVSPRDYSRIEYILTIHNVSTDDFGYYSCRMSFGNQTIESEARLLEIVSPVEEVKWSEYDQSTDTWHQLSSNETIVTGEDKLLIIKCESEGGFPKPKYSIAAKSINDSEKLLDMTSLFHEKVSCHLGKGSKGSQKLVITTKLTPLEEIGRQDIERENISGLKMVHSYHEKNIVCFAEVPQFQDRSLKMKTAEIFIVLNEFRPQFTCGNRFLVEPNSQNVSITCIIKARPGIQRLKIFHNGTLSVDQRNGEYMADTEVINGTNEEHVRSTLTIFRVSWKHFGKYEFVAINDLGNTTHIVELIRDNKSQKTLSQKSIASSSFRIGIKIIVTVLFIGVVRPT